MMEEIVRLLPGATTRRRMQKRAILLCPGDIPHQIYMIRSGCVKAYRLGNAGEEQVAAFKTAGDIFPECWAFDSTSNTMYYYETVDDSEIVTVDKESFLDLLAKRPDLKAKAFDYMVKNHVGLMVHITALEQSLAADKLLMILYYLMVRYGVEKKAGEFWIKMKLRHATLAGLTGLTRETITSELGKLKKKRIVRYSLRHFIIYRSALKDRMGEDVFSEFQFN